MARDPDDDTGMFIQVVLGLKCLAVLFSMIYISAAMLAYLFSLIIHSFDSLGVSLHGK